MGATVPSLEGQTFLTEPQSIIAYILRRYSRTPADTVPILSELIISLPLRMAQFGRDPDTLTKNIQTDLQGVFDRIFANDRRVTVTSSFTMASTNTYNVSVSVIYTLLSGEINQTGTTITLDKTTGRLVIPEDRVQWKESLYSGT